MTESRPIERLDVNQAFAMRPDRAALERAVAGLTRRGYDAHLVGTAAEARDLAASLLTAGAEVGEGATMTIDRIGLTSIVEEGDRYVAVRPKTRAMDRATQRREIRKLGAAPDFFLDSVQALTEDGEMVLASLTGSQLGPIAFGAGRVILVVGAQKIVPDLEIAFRRVREYCYPLVDAMAQEASGRRSAVNKQLILSGDFPPGRTTVVVVDEPIGM
jgi:LUD domain